MDASSTPKTKNDNQLVITTKNEINTISSNDGKIFDVINTVLKRKAEINIKYDEEVAEKEATKPFGICFQQLRN
ncbi:hypothetical protein EfmAA610_06470 [Enterococcus faecium]|nr:hypothetical protein EfmAA610_06470 [Enterococcus faecium]